MDKNSSFNGSHFARSIAYQSYVSDQFCLDVFPNPWDRPEEMIDSSIPQNIKDIQLGSNGCLILDPDGSEMIYHLYKIDLEGVYLTSMGWCRELTSFMRKDSKFITFDKLGDHVFVVGKFFNGIREQWETL